MSRMYAGRQLDGQEALMPAIAEYRSRRDRLARTERRRRWIYRAQVLGIVIVGALAAVGFCFLLVAGLTLAGVGKGG